MYLIQCTPSFQTRVKVNPVYRALNEDAARVVEQLCHLSLSACLLCCREDLKMRVEAGLSSVRLQLQS